MLKKTSIFGQDELARLRHQETAWPVRDHSVKHRRLAEAGPSPYDRRYHVPRVQNLLSNRYMYEGQRSIPSLLDERATLVLKDIPGNQSADLVVARGE